MPTSQIKREINYRNVSRLLSVKNINKMATTDEHITKNYTILKEDVPGAILTKKPQDCIVEELKRWLEFDCHGLKKYGRKQESVKRVEDALKLNLPVSLK